MNKNGFTLVEVLTVVVIIGILTSMALPMYTRAIERSRATEAMASIKALNDAVYAYYVDKETCPRKFSLLVVTLPLIEGSTMNARVVSTKFFTFTLDARNVPYIPGTECRGTLAKRRNGGKYYYGIYNPYQLINGQASALACTPVDGSDELRAASIEICESLGMSVPNVLSLDLTND